MKKILIVDDEEDMGIMLRRYLELEGYQVMLATGGREGIEKAAKLPDLILLDINMPDLDGISVCRRIRDHVACPILFLTARVEDRDKLEGFAAGGDDYVVKPFSMEELSARIEAHLRREDRSRQQPHQLMMDDDFVIDYSAREVLYQGKLIALKPREFDIVELLSTHPGLLFSKERIFERIWDMDSDTELTAIMEHISRIRARFAQAGCKPYIQTVWGSGYKWSKQ